MRDVTGLEHEAPGRRLELLISHPHAHATLDHVEGLIFSLVDVQGWPRVGGKEDLVHQQRSFWQRLFGRTGSSSLSARQQKVSDYILGRMENEVPPQQVLREDYVRRNCSQAEVEQVVSSPEFIETARVRLGEAFGSEEFKL